MSSWEMLQEQTKGGKQHFQAFLVSKNRQRSNHGARQWQLLDTLREIFWADAIKYHPSFIRTGAEYARPLQPFLTDSRDLCSILQGPYQIGEALRVKNIGNKVVATNTDNRWDMQELRRVDSWKPRGAGIKRLHQIIFALPRQFQQGIMHLNPLLLVACITGPGCQSKYGNALKRRIELRNAIVSVRIKRSLPRAIEHEDINLYTIIGCQASCNAHNRVFDAASIENVISGGKGDALGIIFVHVPAFPSMP